MKRLLFLSLFGILSITVHAQNIESDTSKKEIKARHEKPSGKKTESDTTKPAQRITVNEEGVGKGRKGKKTANQMATPEGGGTGNQGGRQQSGTQPASNEKKKK